MTDAKEVRVGNPAGRNVPSPDVAIVNNIKEPVQAFFTFFLHSRFFGAIAPFRGELASGNCPVVMARSP